MAWFGRRIKESLFRHVRLLAYPNLPCSPIQRRPSIAIQLALSPLLRVSSYLYCALLRLRYCAYEYGFLRQMRLPLPVISVGNLTWGGTGKTPMTEYIAEIFISMGIKPLILTRGYGGGDEVRQLENHFPANLAIIGVGKDRSAVAKIALMQHGIDRRFFKANLDQRIDLRSLSMDLDTQFPECSMHTGQSSCEISRYKPGIQISKANISKPMMNSEDHEPLGKLEFEFPLNKGIGVAILDDGYQHFRVTRDLNILMINSITFFGNEKLMPRGPMREAFLSLSRADMLVFHHADLAHPDELRKMMNRIRPFCKKSATFFESKMDPKTLLFFGTNGRMKNVDLSVLHGSIVLCVTAIASPASIYITLKKIGVLKVFSLEFEDHHKFESVDYTKIKMNFSLIQKEYEKHSVFVLFSEKDFMRDSEAITYEFSGCNHVCILRSKLSIMGENVAKKHFQSILRDAAYGQTSVNTET